MNAVLSRPVSELTAPELTTEVCRHCGDPCGTPNSDPAVRSGEDVFCCAGCASVYALLHEQGLEGFYACEATPGASQRKAGLREPSRFAVLDDDAVAARFIEFSDSTLTGVTFEAASGPPRRIPAWRHHRITSTPIERTDGASGRAAGAAGATANNPPSVRKSSDPT